MLTKDNQIVALTWQPEDLRVFVRQGQQHLDSLVALLGRDSPPAMAEILKVSMATSALRGSASLLGLEDFQAFLGHIFQLLEDIQSNRIPWSSPFEEVLHSAVSAESTYVEALKNGQDAGLEGKLHRVDSQLASWRRTESERFTSPTKTPDSSPTGSQEASMKALMDEMEQLMISMQRIRTQRAGGAWSPQINAELQRLTREMASLQQVAETSQPIPTDVAHESEPGLRNHCEGGLGRLVEAAAREVLEQAQEHKIRLGIRATGALRRVDDELGGALLQILRNLWLDSMLAQKDEEEARIDTIVRAEEDRIVLEVRDTKAKKPHRLIRSDDVLARYAGLRGSRSAVEALQGLVWAEPRDFPGCRFRVSLPKSVETMCTTQLRIGAHEVAIPSCAIDSVHGYAETRINQDQEGVFVDVRGGRYPVVNLAFIQNDMSFDEVIRDLVVIVGSFERRAALFASGTTCVHQGILKKKPRIPWCGIFDFETGSLPMLDVEALIGRRADATTTRQSGSEDPVTSKGNGVVLIVDSNPEESDALRDLLEGASRRCIVVRAAEEAQSVLESQPVDAMVCDLRLPDMNAQQIAAHRRRTGRFADVPLLLLLNQVGDQSDLVVQQLDASGFIGTPIDGERLLRVIDRLTNES